MLETVSARVGERPNWSVDSDTEPASLSLTLLPDARACSMLPPAARPLRTRISEPKCRQGRSAHFAAPDGSRKKIGMIAEGSARNPPAPTAR